MSILSQMRHRVAFHRREELRQSGKSSRYSWKPPLPNEAAVRCFVQPASANEIELAKLQHNYDLTHTVYFDRDPDLKFMDRIVYNNRVFQVRAKATDDCELNRLWVVDVQETQWQQSQWDS